MQQKVKLQTAKQARTAYMKRNSICSSNKIHVIKQKFYICCVRYIRKGKIMTKDKNWIRLLMKNILLEDIENGEGYIIFLFSSITCVKFLDKSEA